MKETTVNSNMPFFRNPKQMKWYLQRRPGQPANEANYVLGPGQTVQAMDAAEAALLASMGLVDIARETPEVADSLEELRRQLESERAKNQALKSENDKLRLGSEATGLAPKPAASPKKK